jgi:hypothetical protein
MRHSPQRMMDHFTNHALGAAPAASAACGGIACDGCGYPRLGLADDARCPECGAAPPGMVDRRQTPSPMTLGRRRWLRTVLAGLVLLLLSSIATVQTALIMPIASVTVAAVNVPAPKVGIAALVQRSIGDKPGPWGVFGTMGVLVTLVAVWLITEPENPESAGLFTLAGATRWGCIGCAGAIFGLLLSFNEIFLSRNGSVGRSVLFAAVALGEMPANLLLYIYLVRLARRLDNPRAQRLLTPCAFAIPLLTLLSLGIFAWAELPDPIMPVMRIPVALFVAGAVGVGVAANVGVLYLAQPLIMLALPEFIATARHGLLRLPRLGDRIVRALNDNTGRWCVVAGLTLWLWLIPQAISISLNWPFRQALGGDIPALNFPGPKIMLVAMAHGTTQWYDQLPVTDVFSFIALQLLAVWLMTVPLPGVAPGFGRTARRMATLIGGAALGWGMSANLLPRKNPMIIDMQYSIVMTILQAPATMLLYWHLSRVARSLGWRRAARRLWWLGIAVPPLTLLPGALTLKPSYSLAWRDAVPQNILMAPVMALEVAAGIAACFAMARLAWRLAATPGGPAVANMAEDTDRFTPRA